MQTFVPYGLVHRATAVSLDMKRLGKQRVEGLQILNTITGRSTGWVNHPAVKMWRGFPEHLAGYTITMCNHWISLGYKDTCKEKILSIVPDASIEAPFPEWLNDEEIVMSHRSNLIRKFPEHYGQLWPEIDPTLPYKWPVQ